MSILSDEQISVAAALFVDVRNDGAKLRSLPDNLQPIGNDAAHAIQDLVTARLGETVGGWKMNLLPDGGVARAPIFKSCEFASPARIRADLMPLRWIEAEIGFRFQMPLPPSAEPYSRAQVMAAVQPCVVIEILDSRFESPDDVSPGERLADFISHGGIVTGEPLADWTTIDLADLEVTVTVDGHIIKRCKATHPVGDPLAPALALVNVLRMQGGVAPGQIMITGSWTGADYVAPDAEVTVNFTRFAPVRLAFTDA